jgi:predicted DNA-binding protein
MTTLTLELPPELYDRLHAEADRLGIPAPAIVQEWVAERLPTPSSMTDRERATEALRVAGLLAELSPEEKQRAARSTATLEEVQAALGRVGGKPLSELILEMRGSKE